MLDKITSIAELLGKSLARNDVIMSFQILMQRLSIP